MADIKKVMLIHYHEIGLKGHNRRSFERRLQKNLEALLHDFDINRSSIISGRVLIEFSDTADVDTQMAASSLASKVPGVARVSVGVSCDRDFQVMCECALEEFERCLPAHSFKVKAKRAHTDFEIDSMAMNRDIGAYIYERHPEVAVKMKEPDIQVCVEVIQNASYIYAFTIPGIGGLPVGVSGNLVCLLSSGIDSPVALWRMARRGARCIGVHFSGRPETSDVSEYLVKDISGVLRKTGCISAIYTVALGEYQREISLYAPPSLRVILYRRLMMKVAERIALRERAGALVTGESLGQVASQTLDNIRATDCSVDMPIFRPLIGTDKQEIINEAEVLGTFDISTQDAPDCCTLFMPRNPETHAKLKEVLEAESKFPIDQWVEELASSAEYESFKADLK